MPKFRPFDPHGEIRFYHRNLPHWRQKGATYFVTFRQADSIPAKVLEEWLDVRNRWLRAHRISPEWLKANDKRFATAYRQIPVAVRRAFEKEQAKMLHEELDRSYGSCVLKHETPRAEIVKSLSHFDGQRLDLGDYVVMPNHVHAIIQPFDDWELEDLLASIKRFTSRVIGVWLDLKPECVQAPEKLHSEDRFWQLESYDRIVRDADELAAFRKYIAENGSKANLPSDRFTHQVAEWR